MPAKRDYKKEYKNYHGKPAQRKRRSNRVLSRRKMIAAGKAKKGDGKDVHHKDRNPGNKSMKNMKSVSKHKNRSYSRKGQGRGKRKR